MTAGHGIVHSERSEPKDKSFDLEGIQLWLSLPKEHKDVNPSFYHCKVDQLPLIRKRGIKLHLIAGEALGEKSSVPVYYELFYLNGEGTAGSSIELQTKSQHELAVYVIQGSVKISEQNFTRYDLIILEKGENLNLYFEDNSHIMIFGGKAFPQSRHLWWNFVSTSKGKMH